MKNNQSKSTFIKRLISFLIIGITLLSKTILMNLMLVYLSYTDYTDAQLSVLNGIIFLFAFVALVPQLKTVIGKSILAIVTAVIYLGQMLLDVSFYKVIYETRLPTVDCTLVEWLSINTRLLTEGFEPVFHGSALIMLLLCAFVIVFFQIKPKMINSIKNKFIKNLKKTSKSFYFDFIFEHFVDYLSLEEFYEIKNFYENTELKTGVVSVEWEEENFNQIEKRISVRLSCEEK